MARDPYDVVAHFDRLPDDALVSPPVTAILLNCTDRHLRRDPPIPRRRISARVGGFRVGDIRALIRGLAASPTA